MALLPDPTATLTRADQAIYNHILARRRAKGIDHLGPYIPLLNHPQLARRIDELGYFYKFEGVLPRNVYEFVVLMAATRSSSTFVWNDHLEAARAAALPDAVIQGIKNGAGTFEAPYDIVHEAAGCAFAYKSIPADLQNRVVSRFGFKGLIEIVTLCGFYSLMSMVNVCFDVASMSEGGH